MIIESSTTRASWATATPRATPHSRRASVCPLVAESAAGHKGTSWFPGYVSHRVWEGKRPGEAGESPTLTLPGHTLGAEGKGGGWREWLQASLEAEFSSIAMSLN